MPRKGSTDQILAAQKKEEKEKISLGEIYKKKGEKKGKTWTVQNSISSCKLNKFEIKTEILI